MLIFLFKENVQFLFLLYPKNEAVHEFPPIFFKWLKNKNYRHILLTETCHCHFKLSKVIQFGKNNRSVF